MQFLKKFRTNRKLILIILLIVIIVAIGIWCTLKDPNVLIMKLSESLKVDKNETKTEGGNKIEGWYTYKNEEYKYEIQYPPDWKFYLGGYETDPGVLNITRFFTKTMINSVIKIRVYQSPNDNYQQIIQGKEKVKNPRAIEKRNDKYYFLISYFGEEGGIDIFDKMVSTFKFIE